MAEETVQAVPGKVAEVVAEVVWEEEVMVTEVEEKVVVD